MSFNVQISIFSSFFSPERLLGVIEYTKEGFTFKAKSSNQDRTSLLYSKELLSCTGLRDSGDVIELTAFEHFCVHPDHFTLVT